MLTLLLTYSVAVLLGSVVPGPTTAVLLRQTLRGGRMASVWTLAGNETGVLLWGLAVGFGVSGLIATSHLAYDVMRGAGAVVLIWLGAQALWHHRRRPKASHGDIIETPAEGGQEAGRWRNYRIGLITIVSNPKYPIFAVSFLPQFVPPDVPPIPMFVLLSVLWVILDSSWYLGFIWFTHQLRRILDRPRVRSWLERITGGILVGLGLRLIIGS
jgi:threonine/homoserine/homoserine lactone efflux protein